MERFATLLNLNLRSCNVLQQNGLACPRRCNDQRPLTLADRANQINDPSRFILDGRILDLHIQTFIWV